MAEPRDPFVDLIGIEKTFPGLPALRIRRLTIGAGDRVALVGIDAGTAEGLMHLITGAALPDAGEVRRDGRSTRDVATDTEWLASLDRVGIVTERAVLLESLTVAANLAMPMTLSIDPMAAEIRARVERLAAEVELAPPVVDAAVSSLTTLDRMRLHLARALAVEPAVLLLEHPAARLDAASAQAFGATLARVGAGRPLAWLAMTADGPFARASGGRRRRIETGTGELKDEGSWWTRIWPWR